MNSIRKEFLQRKAERIDAQQKLVDKLGTLEANSQDEFLKLQRMALQFNILKEIESKYAAVEHYENLITK
jgi:hypothetical protein